MPQNQNGDRLLGIDPGLNVTGYGVVEVVDRSLKLIEAGVIKTKAKGSLGVRLKQLHVGIVELLEAFGPKVLALEELYSHYERPRTSILMGHARGVICLAAEQHDIPVESYAATQVKKLLTGNGRAPKTQMQQAICREFSLKEPPEPHDVADALAISVCHYYLNRTQAGLMLRG